MRLIGPHPLVRGHEATIGRRLGLPGLRYQASHDLRCSSNSASKSHSQASIATEGELKIPRKGQLSAVYSLQLIRICTKSWARGVRHVHFNCPVAPPHLPWLRRLSQQTPRSGRNSCSDGAFSADGLLAGKVKAAQSAGCARRFVAVHPA